VARGYTKALARARTLVYVEDQYLWGHHISDAFVRALSDHPELRVMAVIPMHTDKSGALNRTPQLLGRQRAIQAMQDVAPDRFAVYGIENHAGTPVYVHAKTCLMDDTWASVGSDNFNRRSWTHDSELSAVVVDEAGTYAQRLRLTLAAEHLDRSPDDVEELADPVAMFDAYAASAARLDAWHEGGKQGPRPLGRLRRQHAPQLSRFARAWALPAYLWLHDPDGRPKPLRQRDAY
jgi:phosphatidylserine/phosphatidylglycerophosphate/cardiolipin synthase-like enzyme